MGLYRRKDSPVFWMSFTKDGISYDRSTKTSDKRVAEAILGKIKAQIVEGKWFNVSQAKSYSFEQLMDEYITTHSMVNKTPETCQRDRDYIKHLSRIFGEMTLDKITPELVSMYKKLRVRDGAKPATIKNELVCLNHALNLATSEWQWIAHNPILGVKKPVVANKIDRWLLQDEETALMGACHDRAWLQDVIIFALNTGVRQGGIRDLKWKDVDMFRRTATIKKKSRMGMGKYTIPLNYTVMELLTRLKKGASNINGFVFTRNGLPMTKRIVQRAFQTAVTRAGLTSFRFHDLRHTFATRMVQAGVDIYAVSKLLGHASIKETERYAHHSPESVRHGVETLERSQAQKLVEKKAQIG